MGNSSHPELVLNPNCMTTLDWIEAQSNDRIVGDIIKMYKTKELQKGRETDSQESETIP